MPADSVNWTLPLPRPAAAPGVARFADHAALSTVVGVALAAPACIDACIDDRAGITVMPPLPAPALPPAPAIAGIEPTPPEPLAAVMLPPLPPVTAGVIGATAPPVPPVAAVIAIPDAHPVGPGGCPSGHTTLSA